MKKLIDKILTIACVVFLIWGFLSWAEICCKNLSENPQYSEYNMIVNFSEWATENNIPR